MKNYSSNRDYNNYGKKTTAAQKKRVLILLISFATIIILIQVIYNFVVFPLLKLSKIEIKSDLDSSTISVIGQQIKSIIKEKDYFNIDIGKIEKKLKNNHKIKSVYVEKKFPNSLVVVLEKRNPLLKTKGDMYLDENAVIFEENNFIKYHVPDSNINEKDKLNENIIYFLKNLKEIRQNKLDYFNLIEKIEFVRQKDNFKIFLYVKGFSVPFLISKNINHKMIKYILVCKKIFLSKQQELSRINFFDFRGNSIVYTYKN